MGDAITEGAAEACHRGGPPLNATRTRPEREGSTIFVSGGHADAAVWVNTLQRPGDSPGWYTLLTTTTPLSEGAALAVVVKDFPEMPHQKWDNRDFPRLMRQGAARLRPARPPLPDVASRRTRAVLLEGATLYLSEKDLARKIA